jgi:thiol:disulfide interchange protein DsbD
MGAQAVALTLALGAFAGAFHAVSGTSLVQAAPTSGLSWKEFREEELNTLQAEGRRVFVDFTAAWCVTCQVNERLVLSSPDVVQAFQNARVELRKADWTQKDERIAKILESHGRSGVPLYLYYDFSSRDSKPRVLPEILTPGMVLDVVKGKKP